MWETETNEVNLYTYDDEESSGYDDGLNVIDWGTLAPDLGAYVYRYWDTTPDPDTLKNVDIRFNNRRNAANDTLFWTTYDNPDSNPDRDPDGPKDIQDVAAHELGHVLALRDLWYAAKDTLKTMYSPSVRRQIHRRSLEQADKDGIRWLYPESPKLVASMEREQLPSLAFLGKNYPNPFNSKTTIPFILSKQSRIRLIIYNIAGQKIKTLIDDVFNAGSYTISWEGINNKGQKVASGIFLYRLYTVDKTETQSMVLAQ